MIYPDFQNVWS